MGLVGLSEQALSTFELGFVTLFLSKVFAGRTRALGNAFQALFALQTCEAGLEYYFSARSFEQQAQCAIRNKPTSGHLVARPSEYLNIIFGAVT